MVGRKGNYVIKRSFLVFLVCLCMICTGGIGSVKSRAAEMTEYGDVTKIDVIAGGPSLAEHQKYSYSTALKNEITYIMHFICHFQLTDDGKNLVPNDVSAYSVKTYMADGGVKECGFYGGRFYDDAGKQYAIDSKEYNRFLAFIEALKSKKIVLDDEVMFAPSDWAKDDVEKAVRNGLVPEWNQIGYKEKINRLEVCQLIDSLLNMKNAAALESAENPFSDTADKSIAFLYSLGIIDGKSEHEFDPYGYVTREELSKILSNAYDVLNSAAQKSHSTHEYADNAEISDWASEFVNNMYSLNILIGTPENEFKPRDSVTKEELIIALLRIYK